MGGWGSGDEMGPSPTAEHEGTFISLGTGRQSASTCRAQAIPVFFALRKGVGAARGRLGAVLEAVLEAVPRGRRKLWVFSDSSYDVPEGRPLGRPLGGP